MNLYKFDNTQLQIDQRRNHKEIGKYLEMNDE